METRISTKGQVVLPSRIRRALGLEPGDTLQAEIDGSDIRLTPKKRGGFARESSRIRLPAFLF